jgi:hypothetical protein
MCLAFEQKAEEARKRLGKPKSWIYQQSATFHEDGTVTYSWDKELLDPTIFDCEPGECNLPRKDSRP